MKRENVRSPKRDLSKVEVIYAPARRLVSKTRVEPLPSVIVQAERPKTERPKTIPPTRK